MVHGVGVSQKLSALQVCSFVPCSIEFRASGSEHEAALPTGLRRDVKWGFTLAFGECRWGFEEKVVSV